MFICFDFKFFLKYCYDQSDIIQHFADHLGDLDADFVSHAVVTGVHAQILLYKCCSSASLGGCQATSWCIYNSGYKLSITHEMEMMGSFYKVFFLINFFSYLPLG